MALRTVGGGKYVVQTGTTAAPAVNHEQNLWDVKNRAETRASQGAGAQELLGYRTSADKERSLMGVSNDSAIYGADASAADLLKHIRQTQNQVTDTGTVQPAGPPQPATPSQPSQPSTGFINSIYDNQQAAQMQKLREARDIALQQLNKIQTGAEQSAYDNRNSADSAYNQNAKKISELMANNGTMQSGDMTSASSNLMASRQGEIGSINRGLGNTLTDVNERRGLINNNAMGDEQSLMQTIEAARSGALLNDYYHNDDRALQVAQLMGMYNGQQTMDARNADRSFGLQQGSLTGTYGGQRTLPGQQFDRGAYESDRNYDRGTFESDRNFNFQQAQQEWDNTFKQGTFDYQKASDLWERQFKDKSFDQSVKQFSQQMGLDWSKLNQDQQQFVTQQAYRDKALGWDMSNDNPANQSKSSGGSSGSGGQKPPKIDSKTSTDNYNIITGDLQTQGVTKDQARKLVEANRDNLTDSDYRKLMDDINANF